MPGPEAEAHAQQKSCASTTMLIDMIRLNESQFDDADQDSLATIDVNYNSTTDTLNTYIQHDVLNVGSWPGNERLHARSFAAFAGSAMARASKA